MALQDRKKIIGKFLIVYVFQNICNSVIFHHPPLLVALTSLEPHP